MELLQFYTAGREKRIGPIVMIISGQLFTKRYRQVGGSSEKRNPKWLWLHVAKLKEVNPHSAKHSNNLQVLEGSEVQRGRGII